MLELNVIISYYLALMNWITISRSHKNYNNVAFVGGMYKSQQLLISQKNGGVRIRHVSASLTALMLYTSMRGKRIMYKQACLHVDYAFSAHSIMCTLLFYCHESSFLSTMTSKLRRKWRASPAHKRRMMNRSV